MGKPSPSSRPEQLDALWDRMARFAPYERPVGDRWGNRGLFTAAGGNFDHKLTELITNMLDALVLRQAVEDVGAEVLDSEQWAELFETPAAAVRELFGSGGPSDTAVRGSCELRSAGPNRKRERTIVFRDLGIGMRPDEIADTLLRVGSSRKDGVLWLMGAFGRGGLTVLPNAHGWIVLTRSSACSRGRSCADRRPVAARGEPQTETALYQVVSPWAGTATGPVRWCFPYQPARTSSVEPAYRLWASAPRASGSRAWVTNAHWTRSLIPDYSSLRFLFT